MPHFNDIDEREGGAETASDAELLLVELLYGELDGEERARAEARVREDDALAGELEALSHIRALMRELPEEEPPDAVSAKILHAAAAHAPGQRAADADREGSSLWDWLRRMFLPIAMHPGLAAAASVLLVGGVAGMLYLSGRMQIAKVQHEKAQVLSEAARGPARAAPAADEMATAGAPAGAASARPEADLTAAPAEAAPEDREVEGAQQRSAKDQVLDRGALGAEEQRQELALDRDRVRRVAAEAEAARRDAVEQKRKRSARSERRTRSAPGRAKLAADSLADDDRAAYRLPEAANKPTANIGGLSGGDTGVAGGAAGGAASGRGGPGASSGSRPAAEPPPPRAQAPAKKRAAPAPAAPVARQEASAEFAEPPPAADEEPAPARSGKGESPAASARALHDRARAAADRDDCKTVIALGRKIRDLDPRYHRERFNRDQRVRACLAAEDKAAGAKK